MNYKKIAKEVLLIEAKELENAAFLIGDKIGRGVLGV